MITARDMTNTAASVERIKADIDSLLYKMEEVLEGPRHPSNQGNLKRYKAAVKKADRASTLLLSALDDLRP